LTHNLLGMQGFVQSLPSQNEKVQELLLHKIATLNAEIALLAEPHSDKILLPFIKNLAQSLEALIFAQPNTAISQASTQHFLNENLELILDTEGNGAIEDLNIRIQAHYYDQPKENIREAQSQRKAQSEAFIQSQHLKINPQLPVINSEEHTRLRSKTEIAQRVAALAVSNAVAFEEMESEAALEYLDSFGLLSILSPNELAFIKNPSPDRRLQETWKCEGIWTLLWALKKVDSLPFPNQPIDLSIVPAEVYPIGLDKDPNAFIQESHSLRSKKELLDANDLYFRLDWTCVDARLQGQELEKVHPGVVYERHYALNWLISYQNQAWDEVTCDT
ncbi:MAG: DUF4272 domain-containing protein, partial [Bacteroidota bacterium]